MRHLVIYLITIGSVALLCSCLEVEEREFEAKSVPRCSDSGACADGEVCMDGLCRAVCVADVECPGAEICLDGLCWSGAGDTCDSDAACAEGEVCVEHTCVADVEAMGCGADAECPPEHSCMAGVCTFTGTSECTPSPEVCDGLDNDCDGEVDEGCDSSPDADGDGFTAAVDCDDTNALVHPGAIEECDGLDNDCDGEADEDCVELPCEDFEDCMGMPCETDDDCGFGLSCIAGHCGDDSGCTPEPEICDGLDNDCDGLVDEGCDSGPDADGDGFPAGADCDDMNPSVHPGAFEVCDGLDNDCDGEIDEGCAGSGGCGGDAECGPGEACIDGMCVPFDDCEPEICDGIDNDCDGMVDEGCGGSGGCGSDDDCGPGELCMDGVCVDGGGGFPDADGDGFPAGEDCDDMDPSINPAAWDICDGIDNDCDGWVDEDC